MIYYQYSKMSNYIQEHLLPGETLIYKTRLHWMIFSPAIVLGIVTFISLGFGVGAFIFWLFLTVIVAVFIHIGRVNSEFGITDKRVLIKTGILRTKSLELLLSKIEGIYVNQNIFGRMFGYGTIVVNGVGGTKEPFDRIEAPMEFRKRVHEQISTA